MGDGPCPEPTGRACNTSKDLPATYFGNRHPDSDSIPVIAPEHHYQFFSSCLLFH